MLRNLVIFSLCFVAIRACGEFSVLSSPNSLSFKGSDALPSEHVGDVLLAATGNPVAESAQWNPLTIDDPFNLATGGVAMYCDGINHLSLSSNAKTFPLKGNNADESLKAVAAELKSANTAVCDIDFTQFSDALEQYRACFGDVAVPTVQGTKNLNPATSTADKEFLQTIALVNQAAKNWAAIKKNNQFVIFRMSMESLVKEHGEKSPAVAEASKAVSSAVSNFNEEFTKSSKNTELFVVVANKDSGSRTKRQATPRASDDTTYNLAEYYNDDYPVIFNIILWFMVTFGLALLAICYAIGAMDPGRDSIIYRMTSTRMKKDN